MADVKTFVSNNKTTMVICPACNRAEHISVESYRDKEHAIKVRCRCGEIFSLLLDFRHNFRKPTSLPGTYSIITPGKAGGGTAHICNISRSGIGFTVSNQRHNLEKGLQIILEFKLNDKNKTLLRKEVIIRSIKKNNMGSYIGCQFSDNDSLDKALGFYLQF